MASPQPFTDERFEEFQGDKQYEPEYTGLPVSALQPSAQLVDEFAAADRNFQSKIPELVQKYPWMRTIRGDGNCGIRALCFGYFEFLLCHGTKQHIDGEIARFQSMETLVTALGHDPSDFNEATFDFFQDLISWLPLSLEDKYKALEEAFDNPHVLFYFRLLAAAYINSREDYYSEFVIDKAVQEIIKELLRFDEYVDQFAIGAIYDLILEPVGLALETLDLNRSESMESVSVISHMPKNVSEPAGVLRLLYRPGHFDLIYGENAMPQ